MGKAKIFLFFLVSFVCGVGLASFGLALDSFIIFAFIIGLIVTLIFVWKYKILRLVLLCCVAIVMGIWRYGFSQPVVTDEHIAFYNGTEKKFLGKIVEEPDIRKEHVKLTVKPDNFSGKVLLNTELFPEYKYGDQLEIKCNLETPEKIEDFSYDKYLSRFGIYSICYRPYIKIVSNNNGSAILAWLYSIKGGFVQTTNRLLPEPQASFLGGLLLGAKRGIPEGLMEDFNRTGTTHIVAISGYNITIIAVLMLSLCKNIGIPRKQAFWVIIIALLFFMLITGAQASVVRAVIMGIVVLIAKQLGRLSRITNALILTAVIMLIINPKILIFDAGFQLSFLATMGLIYLSPLLEKLFTWLPEKFQIKESFLATLSATIFTLPLILFQFGRLSIVALVVNVLILPVIPVSMGLGFGAGLLSSIWLPIGKIFAWAVWLLLSYIIKIVELFSILPFASVEIPEVSWVILVLGYLLLIIGMKFFSKKQNRSPEIKTT
ncbi:ComEC family competence protein [Patescibacteria group bacterium]|nr:ComEC family competence protein [Patescibacteria group bacterium]